MQHLQPFRIRDFAKVISGFAFKSEDFNDEEGVPVVKITNIKNEDLEFGLNGQQYVSESFLSKLDSKYLVQNGDILISLTGSHLSQPNSVVGRVAYNRHSCVSLLNQRAGKFILTNKKIIDNDFLYYYLSSSSIRREIALKAKGAANQANISPGDVESVSLMLPSLHVQQKIASILSAYDDLIENNKQRIKLLEEMAEEIYKEWFVRFRFPGYESTRFLDEKGKEVPHGTPGALPAGWTLTALKDCLKFYIGGGWGEDSPSTASQEPAYVIRGTDIPSTKVGNPNFQILRYHTKSNLSNRLLEENDIVFEVSGGTESQSLGRALLMSKELLERYDRSVICASFCKLIRTDTEVASPFYLYQLLERLYNTGEIMLFQVQSTGISNYKFEEFVSRQKVTVPSKSIQKRFEHFLKPVIQEIQLLGSKNQLLQQTRDLLLPRLIGGKLSVEHLVEQELESLSLAAEPELIYSK